MNGIYISNEAQRIHRKQGQRRYWSGFSVCLFIVLLSVFTWVIHRRLTQYEAVQHAGAHHMTAIKVCLTERPRISMPSTHTMDDSTMFLFAIAFAGALFRMDDSQESPIRSDRPPRPSRTRIRPFLAHFFFLPPPTLPIAL